MVSSANLSPDQALKALTDSIKFRDDELESLKKQITQLRLELDQTSAERDHLRQAKDRRDRQVTTEDERGTRDTTAAGQPKADFSREPGSSKASQIEDSRIGRPKKILIIGGGPAGLISLHEMLNPVNRPEGEKLDEYEIRLFERRAEVGGVWYFEPENDIAKGWHHGTKGWHAPYEEASRKSARNGDANGETSAGDMESLHWMKPNVAAGDQKEETAADVQEQPNGILSRQESKASESDFCWLTKPQNAPRWPSPAYEGLVGNVLPPLLEFSTEPMQKPANGLFPSMVETHEYLLGVANPLRDYIRTNQEVIKMVPKLHEGVERVSWLVTRIDWNEESGGETVTEEWDAVIVAVGAFDHPWYPMDTPGLKELRQERSSLIMHAKTYPGPRPFVNQNNRFVVVGNANSANDIAAHLAPLNSSGPLYRCIRHESYFAHLPDSRIKDVAPLADIKKAPDGLTLNLTLEDGTQLNGITMLIFASGYQYRFEWLKVPTVDAKIDAANAASVPLTGASKHGAVPYLHNATLHAAAPTLAFVGLCAGSSPMPLAEIQARTVARTWRGLEGLPADRDGLLASYRERAEELGVSDDNPGRWRALHQVRGAPERKITDALITALEEGEPNATDGLFRWDSWRESVAKGMREAKEKELRRLRNARVAAGGVDGGVGGILAVSYGPSVGQKFTPVWGTRSSGRGKGLAL